MDIIINTCNFFFLIFQIFEEINLGQRKRVKMYQQFLKRDDECRIIVF